MQAFQYEAQVAGLVGPDVRLSPSGLKRTKSSKSSQEVTYNYNPQEMWTKKGYKRPMSA